MCLPSTLQFSGHFYDDSKEQNGWYLQFFQYCNHIKSFALDDGLAAFYNDTHPHSNANLHMPVFLLLLCFVPSTYISLLLTE